MNVTLDFSGIHRGKADSVCYSPGSLNLYQRLIQYFTIVGEAGAEYLDLINFNRSIYREVLTIQEIEEVFQPEHGYACPDASVELGELIRSYELGRASRFAQSVASRRLGEAHFRNLAVGCGAGTTGVMNCLLPAIRDLEVKAGRGQRRAVILTLPQYSVYDGIVSEHGLAPIYLATKLEHGFLPTVQEMEDALVHEPLAVLLTFPVNPAQTTFHGDDWLRLAQIVRLCQERKTFLIVDNIYQDTMWERGEIHPEIFAMSDTPDYLVKVFGPSKDRPAWSGLRMGYYIGDSRLREGFFYYSSIQYNTPNSLSRCLFGVDILFRNLRQNGETLTLDHLSMLGDCFAGWGRTLDRPAILDQMLSRNLFGKYVHRLESVEGTQKQANRELIAAASGLGVFRDVINDRIGNVLLLRVAPEVFGGSDHELFLHVLERAGLGILPGNAFGFPVQAGSAWFRITTVHAAPEIIVRDLERLAAVLKT